jgi:hypothetical protein
MQPLPRARSVRPGRPRWRRSAPSPERWAAVALVPRQAERSRSAILCREPGRRADGLRRRSSLTARGPAQRPGGAVALWPPRAPASGRLSRRLRRPRPRWQPSPRRLRRSAPRRGSVRRAAAATHPALWNATVPPAALAPGAARPSPAPDRAPPCPSSVRLVHPAAESAGSGPTTTPQGEDRLWPPEQRDPTEARPEERATPAPREPRSRRCPSLPQGWPGHGKGRTSRPGRATRPGGATRCQPNGRQRVSRPEDGGRQVAREPLRASPALRLPALARREEDRSAHQEELRSQQGAQRPDPARAASEHRQPPEWEPGLAR